MCRAKSACSRSSRSSQARTSWFASVLRGGSSVPSATMPELLLAGEPLGPQLVPPAVVAAAVLLDVLGPGVQRRVHRAVREVHEERLRGVARLALADHRDRAVGEVVGEVVVVGVLVDLDEVVVLDDAVRVVQVRERVEDPVEAVEPALARPRVLRACGGAVGVLREVPLAHHHRGVARLVAQDLGDRRRVRAELHRRSRGSRGRGARRCRSRRGATAGR